MQILIFGMHRAGTSMVTRLLNMMGAYFAPEGMGISPRPDNPKGFWERRDVLAINDALLAEHGCTWSNVHAWPGEEGLFPPKNEIQSKMQYLVYGMDAFRPWVMKDPRLCLTFPYWRPYLEVPVAIVVHRNPMEIAVSLQNRNGFPLEYGIALWEHYAVHLLNATWGMNRLLVRYGDLQQNPVRVCEYVYEHLTGLGVRGLTLPSHLEIRSFVDARLYRSKASVSPNITLSDTQQLIGEMLRGMRPQEGKFPVSEGSLQLLRSNPL